MAGRRACWFYYGSPPHHPPALRGHGGPPPRSLASTRCTASWTAAPSRVLQPHRSRGRHPHSLFCVEVSSLWATHFWARGPAMGSPISEISSPRLMFPNRPSSGKSPGTNRARRHAALRAATWVGATLAAVNACRHRAAHSATGAMVARLKEARRHSDFREALPLVLGTRSR